MSSLRLHSVSGTGILPWIDALASLRMEVFREFPYLYEGNTEYERSYLKTYARSSRSVFVLALHGDQVHGVSTGVPLADETPELQQPFIDAGISVDSVFYFGESVLRREFRGQGLGHGFFDHRETYAQSMGYAVTAFCAVRRDPGHPRRPASYRPLEPFWQSRGYVKQTNMLVSLEWKDLDEDAPDHKLLNVWMREWNSNF